MSTLWSALSLRRFFFRAPRPQPIRNRPRPTRNRYRPCLEVLEDRVTPSNVDILTWHYDNTLSGWNNQETILTPSNVNALSFGRQITYGVDGFTFAQPLYKGDLAIAGGTANVVFAATQHNSVYAFDADNRLAGPNGNGLYWQVNFTDVAAGLRPGFTVTTMPSAETQSGDIVPEVGITGTPVIDAATNTMYVVAKTKEVDNATPTEVHYVHRLYAINIQDGTVLRNTLIGDTLARLAGHPLGANTDAVNTTDIVVSSANTGRPGDTGAPTGPGVINGMLAFNSRRALHRSALVMAPATELFPNGLIYMDFASHGDNGPYRGWVIGYDPQTFELEQFFVTALDARGAGIWQSGSPIALDTQGNIFFATGNAFGVTVGGAAPIGPRNLSESVVKLRTNPSTGQLELDDWFIPHNWQFLDQVDADLGSGGTLILPQAVGDLLPDGTRRQLIVETGKEGKIYLLDRNDLGRLSANQDAETARIRDILIQGVAGVWGSPSFFEDGPNTGLLYYHGSGDFAKAFRITNGQFVRGPEAGASVARTNNFWGFPGGQPTVSSNGTSNAIVWELRSDAFNQGGPTILYAYNAVPQNVPGQGNRLVELYASNQVGQRDQLGPATKFVTPVISNGRVFAGTANTLEIFGLFPAANAAPVAPTNLGATANSPTQITLAWTNPTPASGAAATVIRIERSTDNVNFTQIQLVGADRTSFVDTGLQPATRYFYRLQAQNSAGSSPFSNIADARTLIPSANLGVYSVVSGRVDLFWSPVAPADAGYQVERSTDNFQTFTVAGTLPAGATFFTDTGLEPQLYLYRVRALSSSGETSVSNVVIANLDPSPIEINYPNFLGATGLAFNGTPNPAVIPQGSQLLVLTNGADFGQTTSAFFTERVPISTFQTEFVFRMHDGTDPRADGFTFIIHNDPRGASALGPAGGGLGFGPDQPNVAGDPRGIRNSVAIKFDIFNNAGESPGGGTVVPNSTGIFTDGRSPSIRRGSLPPTPTALIPDQNINLNTILGSDGFPIIQLNNQEPKRAIITYDGTTLTLRIEDRDNPDEFIEVLFLVDIRGIIGSDIAFVGFTAGTGGLTVVTDIASWFFTPGEVTTPTAPFALFADPYSNPNEVRLAWRAFSPNADGFIIERSTDGTTFTEVDRTGLVLDFFDTPPAAGTYFYRVLGFNDEGSSFPSNVVRAAFLVPDAPTQLRVNSATADVVRLQWLVNSFNHTGFRIERAPGTTSDFVTVGTVNSAFTTTFTDTTVTGPNTFTYRVVAFNDFGDSLTSNAVQAFVPGVVTLIDKSAGFAANSDLTRTNSAAFVNVGATTVARLTPAQNGQSGSVFSNNLVNVAGNWTSQFTFQIHGGSATRADGLAFVIQRNSPTALGGGGGSLGYAGIANSIAIKFDIFDGGTADPSDSTTGLFTNGQGPFGGVDTLPSGIDFRNGRVFEVTMNYTASTNNLQVIIRDTVSNATNTQNYSVNIASVIGGASAFVGFTAATGGLNAIHDVLTWRFESL